MSEFGTYSAEAIGKVLNLKADRVRKLANMGVLPREERGRYPLIGCVHGYIRYLRHLHSSEVGGETYAQHRARLYKARADLAELEAQRVAGDLLPVQHVEAAWRAVILTTKQRLRSIGARVTPLLKAVIHDGERKALIDTEIDAALADLANARIVFDPPSDPAPSGRARRTCPTAPGSSA
jgi:hypothetical protein